MNLSTISLAQLKDLLNTIPTEIKSREKDEKAQTLKELEAFAAERGFSLDELLAPRIAKAKNQRGTVPVKYRHPQNVELTWTGRGRSPKWVVAFLANGGTIDQLVA